VNFTQAIALDTTAVENYLGRSLIYEGWHQPSNAIRDLQEVLDLGPDPATTTAAKARLAALGYELSQAKVKSSPLARIYIQYGDARDSLAVRVLAQGLTQGRYEVTRPQLVLSGRASGDVRFGAASDRESAQDVRMLAENALARSGYRVRLDVLPIPAYRNPKPGVLEVWLPPLTKANPFQEKLLR
jgi:hypothetical protein